VRSRAQVLAWAFALAAYGGLLLASAPRWPDDWDGIGFVESVSDFDLARFHPHPPGYPVYVALLRLAALMTRAPMAACVLVAVASTVAMVALVTDAVWRTVGLRTAAAVGAVLGVMPLVWRAGSGVGSEAPALACMAACAWGLVACGANRRVGPVALGLAVGLGLGVRLSWAPVYLAALALAPRAARGRAWGAAAASCVAWVVPLLLVVGPGRLVALSTAHLEGHAARWGGTVVTTPGWIRAAWLARDVFVDALGVDLDAPGLAIGVLLIAVSIQAWLAWRRARWVGWRPALALVLPYLAWIALGQNLRDQPRHVLPIAASLASALGLSAAFSRRGFALVSSLALAMSIRTALDAHARRTIPPAGQQVVDLVRAQPAPGRIDVFGVTSIRFFEGTELSGQALPAGSLGDVQVGLTRVERLPARVWLTDEVETGGQSRWPIEPLATLCRPARLDRRARCLQVSEWRPPFLPPQ
jgi:hypothetical protein